VESSRTGLVRFPDKPGVTAKVVDKLHANIR
jgi:hypothetical protein